MKERTRRLDGYVLLVAAMGVAGLIASVRTIRPEHLDALTVTVLVVMAAATQRMPVFLFRSSAISVSFAAVIATFVLYGTGVAVFVSLAQAAVNAFTPRRKPLIKVAFNAGSLATSAFVGGQTYTLVGGHVPPGDIPLTLVAVAAAALAYFLVNTGLTAAVIAISEGQNIVRVWRTNYAWMPVNFLATAVQGAALALASQALGVFGVLVFTLPLTIAWYSFKLYMSKSSEVRQRNAELQTVNETLRRTNVQLEKSHLSVIGALVGALEAKERLTASHSAHTMDYALKVAAHLGLSAEQQAEIKLAALFHDIGKIGVPEALLRKAAKLDDAEWAEVKAHPTIGANLLSNVPMLNKIAPIVLAHHERYDGKGYPNGLFADQIPLAAQIISVADAFEAMTADRPYRKAMPRKQALRELRACAGSQFNPVVVEAFIGAVVANRHRPADFEQGFQHVFAQAVEAVRVGI